MFQGDNELAVKSATISGNSDLAVETSHRGVLRCYETLLYCLYTIELCMDILFWSTLRTLSLWACNSLIWLNLYPICAILCLS